MERRSARGHDDERVGSHRVGPLRRQRDKLALPVLEVDAILLPIPPALDELELQAR
jgi:hypothetical protein